MLGPREADLTQRYPACHVARSPSRTWASLALTKGRMPNPWLQAGLQEAAFFLFWLLGVSQVGDAERGPHPRWPWTEPPPPCASAPA